MAKGKQSAALFEVIHTSKQYDRGGRSILRTPKWWFKRRDSVVGDSSTSSAPAPAFSETPSSSNGGLATGAGGIRVHIDPDGQHINARFSYTATVVVVFTVGVLIVLAYMIGRGMNSGSTPMISTVSTEELRNQPTRPEVMKINRAASAAKVEIEPVADDGTVAAQVTGQPAPQWYDPGGPTTVVVDGANRNVGLNYVIIQSYGKDRKIAEEAVKVLKENGVDCTIEEGIKGWPGAVCVVGTRGFSGISSPEYKNYEKKIQAVSKIFAPKGGWKAFNPTAKRWDQGN
jgi:hypothetical protein